MTRTPTRGSVRRTIVTLTAVVTAVSMLLVTVVLQLVLADLGRRDVGRLLEERTDAVFSSISGATTGDRLVVPDADLDPGIVVYDAQGRYVAGTVADELRDASARLGTSTDVEVVDVGESDRLRATPFTTASGATGVIVAVEPLAAHESAERYALLVSLVTGLLATVFAALMAAWVTGRALRPVAELTATADDWSQHDLNSRFDLGPATDEISGLARTLDGLLDKVAAALRSEQRLTSELAHELRTPLTSIQGTADLALMRDELPAEARADLEQIAAASRRMADTITALLHVARTDVGDAPSATCSLAAVVAEVVAAAGDGDRPEFRVDVADLRLAAPHATAVRALAPVVENAARHAAALVTVSAPAVATGLVTITVEDDGPGVAGDADWVFEPGTTSGAGSGAGLGLSIARRMARGLGGDVELAQDRGPTRFVVRLPRA